MVRVAINGFGRIGRNVLRASLKNARFAKEGEIVAINDLGDAKTMAHLLKYDSVHGKLDAQISVEENFLVVNGKKIKLTSEREPEKLPWKEMNIDVVLECTGVFTSREGAGKHLTAGARKVVISAPAKGEVDGTFVIGVNEKNYDKSKHHILSLASCTTNCLAPVAKVLNDKFGIEKGFMTTIHAYTNDQQILDLPHKDLRRARAAAVSIIPTTTGAAKAVGLVLPELKGKLDGIATRVPIPDGSLNDLVVTLKKEATAEEINAALKAAAHGELKGIMEYVEEPVVSIDIVGNPASSIVDGLGTKTIGNMAKVLSWYDNEWGYSCRLVDFSLLVGK